MLFAIYLVALLGYTEAMVCFNGICEHLRKPELNCKGGVMEKGSLCRCFDVCAKVSLCIF